MKKTLASEILAMTLAMVGAVLLVFTYYPVINPIQYKIDNHRAAAPVSRYPQAANIALSGLATV